MSLASRAESSSHTSRALERRSGYPEGCPSPLKAQAQREGGAERNPGRSRGAARSKDRKAERSWVRYPASLALIGLATGASWLLRPILEPANLVMLFLLAVVISALRWGHVAALVAAVSGTVLFDYFYIPPLFSFAISDVKYFVILTGLLTVGLVTSTLAGQVREQADAARRREAYTASLYAFSRSLAVVNRLEQIFEVVAHRISEIFERPVLILLPGDGGLAASFSSPGIVFGEEERTLANWVLNHGQPAGFGTQIMSGADMFYLPLTASLGVVAVLAVKAQHEEESLFPEQRQLLEAFVSQAALATERALLEQKARQTELLQEADKLQKALLNSVSHGLRTPLASIMGTLSSLSEDQAMLDEVTRRELLDNAREEAARLNRLVGNLLDMTRLEAGTLRLKVEHCDLQDVIGAALAQLREASRRRRIAVDLPADLPLVPMDFVLIAQVLVNLLENAIKYAPAHEPIAVQARLAENDLEILVVDRGVGIPQDNLHGIFDKPCHGARATGTEGTGLGLSICKGFVEAHGGRIWAEPRADRGAIFAFTLPRHANTANPRR